MALESYNADLATEALKKALEENEELMLKFKDANNKVQEAFTKAGGALGGTLGTAASNAWGEGTGESFEKKVKSETEKFFDEKVQPIIKQMQEYAESANQAYGENSPSA